MKQTPSWQALLCGYKSRYFTSKVISKSKHENAVYKPTFSRTAAQHNCKKKIKEKIHIQKFHK